MNTNGQRRAFVGCMCAMLLCGIGQRSEGQSQSVKVEPPALIEIGQPLDDAKELLRELDIEWNNVVLQMTKVEDSDQISFSLGERGVSFVVFYSVAKQRIRSISMFIAPPRVGRASHLFLEAESIGLNSDGSYVVHFSPPAKELEQQDRSNQQKARPGPRPPSSLPR